MYQIIPLSPYRKTLSNILAIAYPNCFPIPMSISIQCDNLLKFKKENGHGMNAIITKVIADIITEDSKFAPLNSVLKRNFFSNKLIMFESVSFSIALDTTYLGEMVASVQLLENAEQKSMKEIHNELLQTQGLTAEKLPIFRKLKGFMRLPSSFQRFILWTTRFLPTSGSQTLGSVGLTNLGRTSVTHFAPFSPKTIIFGLGGIEKKLVKNGEQIDEVQIMTLNMTFNHYVVDGRLCTEFLDSIKEKIESL
jgi:pyruvate/2-oxoglutarate dehydrogenase complex dihydrolipoamide acyltransferase (E2) component